MKAVSIFNKMAAARSPCGGFKNRVLHFRVKNTPLKDKKWNENVQKSFLFGKEGKLFINKSSFEFLLNFQVHFALYGQENCVYEREFMYLLDARFIQKLNAPRFEMDFVLNCAMCALSRFYLRERIHDPDSVTRIALRN